MAEHNDLGVWGENLAVELLTAKGYAISARNIRCAGVEIDVVAMHGNRVVIVEVKTRRSADGDPTFGIDHAKIYRLARAGTAYLRQNNLPHELQIDIITVTGSPETGHVITHVADAVVPPRRR